MMIASDGLVVSVKIQIIAVMRGWTGVVQIEIISWLLRMLLLLCGLIVSFVSIIIREVHTLIIQIRIIDSTA